MCNRQKPRSRPATTKRAAQTNPSKAVGLRPARAAIVALFALTIAAPQVAAAATAECVKPARTAASQPLPWVGGEGLDPRATQALRLLINAEQHGLRASDYGATTLARQAYRFIQDKDGKADGKARRDRFNQDLGNALDCFLQHLHYGSVDGAKLHSLVKGRKRESSMNAIHAAWHDNDIAALEKTFSPDTPRYSALMKALETLRSAAAAEAVWAPGPVPAGKTLRLGDESPRVAAMRARLQFLGDLQVDHDLGEQLDDPRRNARTFDPALLAALNRFQARHGLETDGLLGRRSLAALNTPLRQRVASVEMSLERLRWLPRQSEGPMVIVNLPEFRLDASTEAGVVDLESRVVIGRSKRSETPLFTGAVTRVELNPYWNVPYSIMRDEILPRLRRDAGYLRRKNMEVVRKGGRTTQRITATVLRELRRGKARLRQLPGDGNALGRVKFVLPNREAIFLHDTSQRKLFARDRRDFSHGCVRVQKPAELAKLMLAGNDEWDATRVDDVLAAGDRHVVRPKHTVTVALTYLTASVDSDGRLRFHPDIYRHDHRIGKLLARWSPNDQQGADTDTQLARSWIRALSEQAGAA